MSETAGDRPGILSRICGAAAVAGGIVLLVASAMVMVSVLLRWLTNDPIRGDFELMQIGSGIAVLALFAYGTQTRANIIVDTFTNWLPRRVRGAIDGFWNLVWAVALFILAERSLIGAAETLSSNTQTMVLGLPTWWAVGVGALGFLLTGIAALRWAWLQMARP